MMATPLGSSEMALRPVESLTAREREILQLVARGLTDAQIAGSLFLERCTVSNHVSRILGKLGVPNRTAAVFVAAQSHGPDSGSRTLKREAIETRQLGS